jgi:diguanylate cyclase (GGDEF)-like protein
MESVMASVNNDVGRWRSSGAAIGVLRAGFLRLRGAPAGSAARKDLSPLARAHLTLVAAAAAGTWLAAAAFGRSGGGGGWGASVVLLGLAALAQLFIVEKPGSQSYRLAIVFLLGAVLLLPPAAVALVAALHYVPSWFRFVRSWHVRIVNVACTVLSSLAAWLVYHLLAGDGNARFALAGATAAAVFVLVNHSLLAVMIRLAARIRMRDTKLFSVESLSTDLALAALGVGVAVVWHTNRWTVAFAVAPLVLSYRALHVPQLEIDARMDAKTGLLNAREFEAVLLHELEHATRSDLQFSLLMLDLDHFGKLNNTYGHLAGDAVLRAVAEKIRGELRHGDIAARFGGEEFAVVVPGADHETALHVAERIRAAIAASQIEDETVGAPMSVTISVGVATYPAHGRTPKELTHEADQALYRAKEAGRNAVVGADRAVTPNLVAVG